MVVSYSVKEIHCIGTSTYGMALWRCTHSQRMRTIRFFFKVRKLHNLSAPR